MSNRYFANAVLSNDQLMKAAPSIFATQPWHAMSEKYFFIPTIDIVNKMRGEGFQPYSAMQSVTRIPGKGDFTIAENAKLNKALWTLAEEMKKLAQ